MIPPETLTITKLKCKHSNQRCTYDGRTINGYFLSHSDLSEERKLLIGT